MKAEAPAREESLLSYKGFLAFNLALCAAAFAFLFYLIYFQVPAAGAGEGLSFLPAVNASLNGLSALFLLLGFRAIRRGRIPLHRGLMVSAFITSSLFLACYILHHAVHGDSRFLGQGWIRPVYFFILISHILGSMLALPLVLTSFFLAFRKRFALHRRVSRFTFPLWLYVSVTGVLVFLFLRVYPSSPGYP